MDLDDEGRMRRDLGDGRSLWLAAQLYNWKLIIGPTEAPWYDDDW
jgi:hypothetical protein